MSENAKIRAAVIAVLDEIEVTIPMRNDLSTAGGRRDLQYRFAGRNEYRREVKDVIGGIRERLASEYTVELDKMKFPLGAAGLVMFPGLTECPRCGGDGTFKYQLGRHPGPLEAHGRKCVDCEGTGLVQREIQPQT